RPGIERPAGATAARFRCREEELRHHLPTGPEGGRGRTGRRLFLADPGTPSAAPARAGVLPPVGAGLRSVPAGRGVHLLPGNESMIAEEVQASSTLGPQRSLPQAVWKVRVMTGGRDRTGRCT